MEMPDNVVEYLQKVDEEIIRKGKELHQARISGDYGRAKTVMSEVYDFTFKHYQFLIFFRKEVETRLKAEQNPKIRESAGGFLKSLDSAVEKCAHKLNEFTRIEFGVV